MVIQAVVLGPLNVMVKYMLLSSKQIQKCDLKSTVTGLNPSSISQLTCFMIKMSLFAVKCVEIGKFGISGDAIHQYFSSRNMVNRIS